MAGGEQPTKLDGYQACSQQGVGQDASQIPRIHTGTSKRLAGHELGELQWKQRCSCRGHVAEEAHERLKTAAPNVLAARAGGTVERVVEGLARCTRHGVARQSEMPVSD
jgi:hypothetical protein